MVTADPPSGPINVYSGKPVRVGHLKYVQTTCAVARLGAVLEAAGSVTTNTHPPDARLAAVISPPCNRAISRQRLKPKPLPSPGADEPRKNRSKMNGISAGSIPGPLSATRR